MAIQGVSFEQGDNYTVCCIDEFSDELKDLIREELSYICYGKNQVQEDELEEIPHYSYETTLREFLARFSRQSRSVKKGMAGEFLAHLLIKHYINDLEPISIYFNKEERSIKKGFDLNFRDVNQNAVWYGEVKSGEVNGDDGHDLVNFNLLNKSKRAIQHLLSGERLSIWESVLIDAGLSFAGDEKIEVQRILKGDVRDIKNSTNVNKNAVLVSVLFHDVNNKIDHTQLPGYLTSVLEEETFNQVIVFSIQKEAFEQLHEFLMNDLQAQAEEPNLL